jgi:hypothetical protein
MEIQSTLTSRIAWRVGGIIMAGVFTVIPIIGYLAQGHNPLVFVGFIPATVGLLMIFGLGRSAWIKADASSISYLPTVGSTKAFPRSDLKSIVRVPGWRGLSSLEFHDHENRPIVSCEESFARGDVKRLAQFLGVNLTWDFGSSPLAAKPSAAGDVPSWDEIKSELTPEQIAELEKHMKPPGAGH